MAVLPSRAPAISGIPPIRRSPLKDAMQRMENLKQQTANRGRRPSFPAVPSGLLQRKCSCGGTPGPTGECEECREKRLQQKVGDKQSEMQNHSSVPPIVHEVLRSSGQPLNSSTRDFMEKRFDHDF